MTAHRDLPWTVRRFGHEKYGIYDDRGADIGFAHRAYDADLFAAAPDLLAALKVILEMADEIDDAGPTGASYQSDWWREQLRKAHEAIAKAEGRSTE